MTELTSDNIQRHCDDRLSVVVGYDALVGVGLVHLDLQHLLNTTYELTFSTPQVAGGVLFVEFRIMETIMYVYEGVSLGSPLSVYLSVLNYKWTAFILQFSNRWQLKALSINAQHSPIHAHIDGGVSRQLARLEQLRVMRRQGSN